MKKIGLVLVALLSIFSLSSCLSEADLQVIADGLDIPSSVTADFELPTVNTLGVTLTWAVSSNSFLTIDANGTTAHVTIPRAGIPNQTVVLTATLTAGTTTFDAIFNIVITAPTFNAASITTFVDAMIAAFNAATFTNNSVTISNWNYTTGGANMTVSTIGAATVVNGVANGTVTVTNNTTGVAMRFVLTNVTSNANDVPNGGSAVITVTSGGISAVWNCNFATSPWAITISASN